MPDSEHRNRANDTGHSKNEKEKCGQLVSSRCHVRDAAQPIVGGAVCSITARAAGFSGGGMVIFKSLPSPACPSGERAQVGPKHGSTQEPLPSRNPGRNRL